MRGAMLLHRASIGTPSGGQLRPTGGRDLRLAHRVAKRLWWRAPRRASLLGERAQDRGEMSLYQRDLVL